MRFLNAIDTEDYVPECQLLHFKEWAILVTLVVGLLFLLLFEWPWLLLAQHVTLIIPGNSVIKYGRLYLFLAAKAVLHRLRFVHQLGKAATQSGHFLTAFIGNFNLNEMFPQDIRFKISPGHCQSRLKEGLVQQMIYQSPFQESPTTTATPPLRDFEKL